MSDAISDTIDPVLAGKAAEHREVVVVPIMHRHFSSFLCDAYLVCGIQTMPEAVCVDTGQHVGYDTTPLDNSPLAGAQNSPVDAQIRRPRVSTERNPPFVIRSIALRLRMVSFRGD